MKSKVGCKIDQKYLEYKQIIQHYKMFAIGINYILH